MDGGLNFSFSGLKTAVLRQVQELRPPLPIEDLAASFQAAVVEVLASKTARAAAETDASTVVLAGGVSANQALRQAVKAASDRPVLIPPIEYCTDNAAMIAACGSWRYRAGERAGWDLDIDPGQRLG
jgi:N6-L-threonylcarbamoyladenine synthase